MTTATQVPCQICGQPAFYVAGDKGLCARDFQQLMGLGEPPAPKPAAPKPRSYAHKCAYCRLPVRKGFGYSLTLYETGIPGERLAKSVGTARLCTDCAAKRVKPILRQTTEAMRVSRRSAAVNSFRNRPSVP